MRISPVKSEIGVSKKYGLLGVLMDVLRVVRLCVVCTFVLFAGNKKPVKKRSTKNLLHKHCRCSQRQSVIIKNMKNITSGIDKSEQI